MGEHFNISDINEIQIIVFVKHNEENLSDGLKKLINKLYSAYNGIFLNDKEKPLDKNTNQINKDFQENTYNQKK